MPEAFEINFDGIVGPTHNYAGLSYGNVASLNNKTTLSHPKEAALQGLEKMKFLRDLGIRQAVLPPQERPAIWILRQLGFTGSDQDILEKVAKASPALLNACSSAASMWTANAATTSPSSDTKDGKVHFTPANLTNKFHRSIEHEITSRVLKAIFNKEKYFRHHPTLPQSTFFGDEGAANHTRFCPTYGKKGLEFFVYGQQAFSDDSQKPKEYPARQTLEASQAIARFHELDPKHTYFAQQNPQAIDAGVFHNDVIAVGNQNVLFCHELAYSDQENTVQNLKNLYYEIYNETLMVIEVPQEAVSLSDAVQSYLFNTQLITLPEGDMALIAPKECEEILPVKEYLSQLLLQNYPIKFIHFVDVRQSMKNGGGPACLRFRVVLTEKEIEASNQNVYLTDELYEKLKFWINKHYRDELSQEDLSDPKLLTEVRTALDELTQILNLGSIYPFQRDRP